MKKQLLLLAGITFFASCKESVKEKEIVTEDTTIEKVTVPTESGEDKMCFLKVISKDSIMIDVLRKGDSVSGNFNWKPLEKDKKMMTYKGTINGNTVNAIGIAMAEGMTNREELIFTIDGDNATVKFGEMKESDDGVWRYKDKKGVGTEMLQKVDCK
ncbi:MAG: hypothetical protein EOP48_32735 [Sphingobacteriales bacterium]|nr:MAG: hypothetical protein EOP48_32735 [Sphingobacteriales bacterium]